VLVVVGPLVVVGSVLVVVGPLVVVGSVLVVLASVVVVVGAVVGGAAVVVENASLLVVVPAVVGAWAMNDPAVVVGPLRARASVSGVMVERGGAVVGARGPVVGSDADLGAGSAGMVGSARAGARLGGAGWGSAAEATTAARTPVVSPKATSPSLQGHRDLVRCRGGEGRCRGGGVDMGVVPVRRQRQGLHGPLPKNVAWSYPVTPLAAFAPGCGFDRWDVIKALHVPNLGQPVQACHACQSMQAWTPSGRQVDGRGLVHVWSTSHRNPTVASGL